MDVAKPVLLFVAGAFLCPELARCETESVFSRLSLAFDWRTLTRPGHDEFNGAFHSSLGREYTDILIRRDPQKLEVKSVIGHRDTIASLPFDIGLTITDMLKTERSYGLFGRLQYPPWNTEFEQVFEFANTSAGRETHSASGIRQRFGEVAASATFQRYAYTDGTPERHLIELGSRYSLDQHTNIGADISKGISGGRENKIMFTLERRF
jgi:hypothetical protein